MRSVAFFGTGNLFGSADSEDLTTLSTTLRTEVDNPVGQFDDIKVVLDDDDGVATVNEALQHLNDRERTIITSRILAERPVTLQELADRYQVSRERIRQLESNALKKLKGVLGAETALLTA